MDIYSYGRDDTSGKLHAYECKRYGDHGVIGTELLTFADIRQAVERFENEGLPDLCCSFTLIAATDVQNGFDSERNELRNRLKQKYGINLEIWGREHVWAELSVLPVVAGRFIGEPEFSILTESYYNHARRLAAIQHE